MPSQLKNEDGTEVTAFTEEEVNRLLSEKEAEYSSAVSEKEAALTAAQEKSQELEEQIEKLSSKDHNFSALREQKEASDKKVDALKKELDSLPERIKSEVLEGVMKDHYNDEVKKLSGGDEELRKKIEYHYKRLSDKVETKADIDKKLRDATALADPQPAGSVGAAFSTGGGMTRPSASQPFTQEEKDLGRQLGLTEEDFAKVSK